MALPGADILLEGFIESRNDVRIDQTHSSPYHITRGVHHHHESHRMTHTMTTKADLIQTLLTEIINPPHLPTLPLDITSFTAGRMDDGYIRVVAKRMNLRISTRVLEGRMYLVGVYRL